MSALLIFEVMNLAIDPVCKMTVDEKTAKFKTEYRGTTYYFCAPRVQKGLRERPREVPEELIPL